MAQGTTKGVPIDKDPLLNLDSDLVVPSQKAIKAYVDAKQSQADSDYINVSGDTMTGYLLLHADPTINLHAATKQYVDNYINGLDYKAAAHVGTVAALPAYTVSVNKLVLTGTANGAIPTATFDGHDPLVGERVLIKNESSSANNGIYVVTRVGDGSLPFILTRSADADTSSEIGEATLSIIYGSTLANTIWHCTPASVPITLGTTGLTFIQVGSGSVGTGVANELTYWSSSSSLGSLTGNITTTKQFLSQTGDGSVANSPAWGPLLAADIPNLDTGKITTGTLAVERGGTGATTLTGVVIGNGTSSMTAIEGTAALQILRRNAANNGYEFASASTGVTNLTYTASTRLLESSTGTDVTLPLFSAAAPSGSTTEAGLVPGANTTNTGLFLRSDRTWATAFASGTVATGTGRRLAIYTTTGTGVALGDSLDSTLTAIVIASQATGRIYTIPDSGAAASFVMTAGDQSIGGIKTFSSKILRSGSQSVASWTTSGQAFDSAASTYTDTSTAAAGIVVSRALNTFNQPTLASTNAITVTDAANVYISAAPAAGTNTTITNTHALWVAAGQSRFDGNLITGSTSLNVFNTTATTLNIGGAATTIGVGSTTGTLTLNNPTVVGTQTTVNLWHTASTTVNAFGAATAFALGGTSTASLTASLFANATTSGATKVINIGTAGANGSITNINIGSAVSGATGTTIFSSTANTFAGATTFTTGIVSITSAQNTIGTALNLRNLYDNSVTRTYSNITAVLTVTGPPVVPGYVEITHTSAAVLTAGTLIRLANVTGISGITANTDYYVYSSTATTLRLATTYANAIAGTGIGVASGTYAGPSATLTVYASPGTGTSLAFITGASITPSSITGATIDSVFTAYGPASNQYNFDLVFKTATFGVAATERLRVNATGTSVTGTLSGSTGTLAVGNTNFTGIGNATTPHINVTANSNYAWIKFTGGTSTEFTKAGSGFVRATSEKINFYDGNSPSGIGYLTDGTLPTNGQTLWNSYSTTGGLPSLLFYTGGDYSNQPNSVGGFNFTVHHVASTVDVGFGLGVSPPAFTMVKASSFNNLTQFIIRSPRSQGTAINITNIVPSSPSAGNITITLANVTNLLVGQVVGISGVVTSTTYNGIVGRITAINTGSSTITMVSSVTQTYGSGGVVTPIIATGPGTGNTIGLYFDKDNDLTLLSGTTFTPRNVAVLTYSGTNPATGTYGLFSDTNISQKVTIATNSTNINIAENITSQAFTLNILAGAGFDTLTANSTRAINIGTGYANSNTFFSTTNINIGFSGSVSSRAAVVTNIKFDGNIGFYNTTPQSKPTVTGAKGGNAALTSLCTALATLGLITNSTT